LTETDESPEEPDDPRTRIRRLLVALDASASTLDALDDIARLASRLEIEMQGLFVEDTDLLDLAGHRVVAAYPTRHHAALDHDTIERTMRHQVAEARRAIEAAAARLQIPTTFEVRRGRTAVEVVRSASDHDLIVISRQARGFTLTRESAGHRAGMAVREVIRETKRPVFVIGDRASLSGPLYAAFDGTLSSNHALEFAANIAERRDGGTMTVLLMASSRDEAKGLREAADAHLAAHGLKADFVTILEGGISALCEAIAARRSGVLVLGADQAVLEGGAQDVLENLGCSILLVR
jgi:hypothetical protein